MRYVKWTVIIAFWALVAAMFHYTLPQRDIVRITDTENRRVDFGANAIFWSNADTGEQAGSSNRDVFFIQTVREDGSVMVYRNEDTGWGWPPYFKFDTDNLQAEASDLKSTGEAPRWALMTHYGWRIVYLSVFPNAISLKPIASPDVGKPVPWVNIVILAFTAMVVLALRLRWVRFRQARLDPALEEIQDSWDAAEDAVSEKRSRLRRWLKSWRGP